jgi:adenine-specific DNA-methyltransferase
MGTELLTDSDPTPALPNRAQRVVLHSAADQELTVAAQLMLASVPRWWRRRAREAGLDVDLDVPFPAPLSGIEHYESAAVSHELIDTTPESLADAYVVALSDSVRTKEGRHYTPAALARALYKQAAAQSPSAEGMVWDPASGAGMLLLPALRDWLARNQQADPADTLQRVSEAFGGRDLDHVAVWLGNVILAAELLPLWAQLPEGQRPALPALLTVGDGLQEAPVPTSICVLNPPYGRVRLDPEERLRWSHVVFGHANRYGLFMAAAAASLAPGGVMSALVPAGWLGGSYFQKLRAYLAETAPLVHLTYVNDRAGVFSTGVLQETVLATFRNGGTPQRLTCERITINGTVATEAIASGWVPLQGTGPWLLPRQTGDLDLVRAADAMPHRLKDYGWSVSTGPLVWNRHKDQLFPKPEGNSIKIVWAGDLDGGQLHQDSARDSMRYLELRDRDVPVLVLDKPAVLVQRTTAPEQPRRLLAAALDGETLARWGGRVAIENHVNVLTCSQPESVLTPERLALFLDSEVLDRLYRCLTGSVAVSAYELSALPLPAADVISTWDTGTPAKARDQIEHAYSVLRDE